MKLFLISQDHNFKYDTYDSAVVAAQDEITAKQMNPGAHIWMWCDPEYVVIRYLGEAADDIEQGVVCSSFNAG